MRGKGGFSPWAFEDSLTLPTPWLWISGLQGCEGVRFSSLKPHSPTPTERGHFNRSPWKFFCLRCRDSEQGLYSGIVIFLKDPARWISMPADKPSVSAFLTVVDSIFISLETFLPLNKITGLAKSLFGFFIASYRKTRTNFLVSPITWYSYSTLYFKAFSCTLYHSSWVPH